MNEDLIIRQVSFPIIPDSIDDDMKEYLMALEAVLQDALKGSLLLEDTFEDGIIGN